jgi:hypothetical protein
MNRENGVPERKQVRLRHAIYEKSPEKASPKA